MMYCERCNIDFPEGLRYCKWCGQSLVERRRDTSELHFCPNCSAAVQPKWAFCKACGVRLATAPREPLSVACPQCGTVSNPGALHCLNCGSHLQGHGEAAAGEAPSTTIIALCPTCGERIDPGSVYCKGCGAALYEQQTPFGNSAVICSACQSFNPVGSTACRVCGASLVAAPGQLNEDLSPTQVVTERNSNTLPDLADHLSLRPSGESRRPTDERASEPPHVTVDRVSPPASPDPDSGAYTLAFDSQSTETFQSQSTEVIQSPGTDVFQEGRTNTMWSPAPPAKGGDTSVLPGVAGSKFEQPQPTATLNMGRDTGPVDDEAPASGDEPASGELGHTPSGELSRQAAPVTRIDTEGLGAHGDVRSANETFTFVSDVEKTAPEGTVAFGAGGAPPAGFESRPTPGQFVFEGEAPPKQPNAPKAPAPDAERAAEATQVIGNAAPPPTPTEILPDAARHYETPKPTTAAINQAAQPASGPSNVYYAKGSASTTVAPPPPPKKSRNGLLIGLIAAIFVVGIGFGAWWFLSGRKAAKPIATAPPTDAPVETPKTPEPPTPTAPVAPEGMVMVAAGAYTVGRDDNSDLEKPQHAVNLPAFFIDRTEVTNEAYKKFVEATSHRVPANWQGNDFPTGRANYPVTDITWQDAADYAAWAGKRLPTEAEWEAAARGPQAQRYPWGNEWLPGQANIGVKAGEPAKDNDYPPQIMAVGGFPQGASPAGALDMVGNVWEWTADEFKLYAGNAASLEEVAGKLNFEIKPGVTYRVIRGGAFDGSEQHDGSYRGFVDASRAFPKTGFRCAKDVK